MFHPAMPLRKLCKFCDVEPTSCNGTGTCFSNCSITSICVEEEEICVAIWYVPLHVRMRLPVCRVSCVCVCLYVC